METKEYNSPKMIESMLPSTSFIETFLNEKNDFPYFVKIDIVRELTYIMNAVSHYDVLDTDIVVYKPIDFLKYYAKYENEHKREFKNSDYRQRFGVMLTCLVPHNIKSITIKKRLISKYISSIRGSEKNLNYVAWEEKLGLATYIKIYICDREYFKEKTIRYSRDFHVNSDTRTFCSKDSEGAILIAKKGDIKETLFSTFNTIKTRLFVYKDSEYEIYIKRMVEYWKQAILSLNILGKSIYTFKRKAFGNLTHIFNKRQKIRLNHLQTYIENVLNMLDKNRKKVYTSAYDVARYGLNYIEEIKTQFKTSLDTVYAKYKQRLKKEEFHYKDILFKMKGRIDIVEENIDLLKIIFDDEIKLLLKQDNIIIEH